MNARTSGQSRSRVKNQGGQTGRNRSSVNRVIDADSHVLEPPDMWSRYLEPEFRDRAPYFIKDEQGGEHLVTDGVVHDRIPYPEEGWIARRPGGFDPHERVKDMELEGIDVQVLFPTQGLFIQAVSSIPLAGALCRAYNNWLADYCRAYPDRFVGIGAVPLHDVTEAVKEARRCVTKLGMKGIFVRPNPLNGRTLDDQLYDPLYAVIQELNVTLCVHEATGNFPAAGADRYQNYFLRHLFSHALEQKIACSTIICGGVLERFPKLRVAFLESGVGWLPHWLERMDEHFKGIGYMVPWLKMPPSDYFRRQCFVSADPDEKTIPYVVESVGADYIVFGSDYPHFDMKFPGAVAAVRDRKELSSKAKKKILYETPARLYQIN
ncbi:MAG TPA: amidohydrolase family protein [Candidatus Binatia bacterium]